MAAADAEITRFREILRQIDELEVEFDKVRHIRDIVKGFRARVEGLERRVDGRRRWEWEDICKEKQDFDLFSQRLERRCHLLIRFGWNGYTRVAIFSLDFCRLMAPLYNLCMRVGPWVSERCWLLSLTLVSFCGPRCAEKASGNSHLRSRGLCIQTDFIKALPSSSLSISCSSWL